MRDFSTTSALIFGGSSGVGLETARQLIGAQAPRVAIVGRNRLRLEAAADELRSLGRGAVLAVVGDAADVASASAAVAEVQSRFGAIDVLVNSVAGSTPPDLLHEIPVDEIEATLRGQLLGPLITTRLVIPAMYAQGRGSIVNIASDAAKVATPGETVLGAAMSGIVMFSRAVAVEAKRHGVRVNAVTPSLIEGTRTTELITREGFSAKLFAQAAKQAQLGVPDAADVAELVVFLASDESARITGQAISVNGGISAA